jgi:integrase
MTGMFLAKRNRIYYLWYKTSPNGKKHKISTGCTKKEDALEFLRSYETLSKQSPELDHDLRIARTEPKSLREFTTELLRYVQLHYSPTTLLIYNRSLRLFADAIGDIPLVDIMAHHFDHFKTSRITAIAPTTLNIELRTIKAAMGIAVRWNYILVNPFSKLQLVRVPETTPVYFTQNEIQSLLRVIKEPWLGDIVTFALMTGMRRGELINLKWNNVDMQRRIIQIESDSTYRTKLGRRRTIPLNDTAMHVLVQRHENRTTPGDIVFSYLGESIPANWGTRLLKRYIRKLGLNEKLNFHSLRHSHCSWLVQQGVSLYEVQRLAGHSTAQVTQIYAHLQPEQLHSTVNKINLSTLSTSNF